MKYECVFKIKSDEHLYKALLPDVSNTKRAVLELKKEKDYLKIKINALDAIALKAFTTSILKLLEVHEKVKEM
ncbi:hypothetical protein ISS04_03565 [Candidatus Woesearchaeota archaeon]|nr:hypothetical protein [Candidatus Woesearchaeota archaeon]